MSFSLGSIDPINVQSFDGFDYPETTTVLELIENVVGSGGNAVLQDSALGFREAQISGVVDGSDLATLRGFYEAKSTKTFTDDASTSTGVVVRNLRASRLPLGWWSYSCSLLEIP